MAKLINLLYYLIIKLFIFDAITILMLLNFHPPVGDSFYMKVIELDIVSFFRRNHRFFFYIIEEFNMSVNNIAQHLIQILVPKLLINIT